MAGLGIVIPRTGGPTDPTIELDSMLTAGSLVLIDPAHTANAWATGVPANASTVPNVAWLKAQVVLGAGTAATLAGNVFNVGLTPAGLIERSAKGGLHVIVSRATPPTAGKGFKIEIADLIKNYLMANTTHSYFISAWRNITRMSGLTSGTITSVAGINASSGATSNYMHYMNHLFNIPSAGARLGSRFTTPEALGGRVQNIAVSAWAGTPPTTLATLQAFCASFGYWAAFSGQTTQHQSGVFLRYYLEDLTVSGRTYATVDALDSARFTADVMTAGGRYYGDTFTDPTTIP